jgi:hypothetical protein
MTFGGAENQVPYMRAWYRSRKVPPVFYKLEDEDKRDYNITDNYSEEQKEAFRLAIQNMKDY